MKGNNSYELTESKGLIKLYYNSGILKYEGEHLNGHGKEYSLNGKLSYEGEYLNGQRNGKGKEFFE